jgi:hypothetical protein
MAHKTNTTTMDIKTHLIIQIVVRSQVLRAVRVVRCSGVVSLCLRTLRIQVIHKIQRIRRVALTLLIQQTQAIIQQTRAMIQKAQAMIQPTLQIRLIRLMVLTLLIPPIRQIQDTIPRNQVIQPMALTPPIPLTQATIPPTKDKPTPTTRLKTYPTTTPNLKIILILILNPKMTFKPRTQLKTQKIQMKA